MGCVPLPGASTRKPRVGVGGRRLAALGHVLRDLEPAPGRATAALARFVTCRRGATGRKSGLLTKRGVFRSSSEEEEQSQDAIQAGKGALRQLAVYLRTLGFSLATSPISTSGSTPNPRASWNIVVMLGCRLFLSNREMVVGCSPANSASFSCVKPFSFRMRSSVSEKALVISKPPF